MESERSNNFGSVLQTYRENLNIKRSDFARALGISAAYIAKLESDGKNPSVEMLAKIIHFLQSSGADTNVSQDLLSSLLHINLPRENKDIISDKQELDEQNVIPVHSEILIISDKYLEGMSNQAALQTALNMQRGIYYKFFIPECLPTNWKLAFNAINNELKRTESDDKTIKEQLKVYELPDASFTSRLRITQDPTGNLIGSRYGIEGPKGNNCFVNATPELISFFHKSIIRSISEEDEKIVQVFPR
jgi:transcriptional regulator with XRE-family HTH domain